MRAIEAIRKVPVAVGPEATLEEAARLMDEHAVGALVIVEEGRPTGIVTDRDLVVRGVARSIPADARVDAVMSTEVVTLDAAADVREVFTLLDAHTVRRVLLVKDGKLAGVITADDLLVDAVADLARLARPITGQVVFGHAEPRAVVATR
ncbi:MAG TPA: CBS domain-containing protein [Acidimicrobiia bacterium]